MQPFVAGDHLAQVGIGCCWEQCARRKTQVPARIDKTVKRQLASRPPHRFRIHADQLRRLFGCIAAGENLFFGRVICFRGRETLA